MATKLAAAKGKNVKSAGNYDLTEWAKTITLTVEKPKKPLRVQIYLNKKKEYCFRILAGNNKIIAVGESYKKRVGAMKTIKLIEGLNSFVITDLTK